MKGMHAPFRPLFVLAALLGGCGEEERRDAAVEGGAQGIGGNETAVATGVPLDVIAGEVAGASFDSPVGRMPGEIAEPTGPENPYADDAEAVLEGRQLFVAYNCYGCHGGKGGGGMGPSLRDRSWLYGETAADIFDSIAEGRQHSMPAWQAMLPAEIIWKLTAYIQSMRTEREPDPPMQRAQVAQAAGE